MILKVRFQERRKYPGLTLMKTEGTQSPSISEEQTGMQLKNEVWSKAMNKPSPGDSRARALQSVSAAGRPHQHLLSPKLSYDTRI